MCSVTANTGSFRRLERLNWVTTWKLAATPRSTVDRWAAREFIAGVKIDNLVQIAHNVEIGENSVIASQVGISGSSTLGKQVLVGGQAGHVGALHGGRWGRCWRTGRNFTGENNPRRTSRVGHSGPAARQIQGAIRVARAPTRAGRAGSQIVCRGQDVVTDKHSPITLLSVRHPRERQLSFTWFARARCLLKVRKAALRSSTTS